MVPRRRDKVIFLQCVTNWSCVTPQSAIFTESGNMKDDFGHLLEFLQHLRKLKVSSFMLGQRHTKLLYMVCCACVCSCFSSPVAFSNHEHM